MQWRIRKTYFRIDAVAAVRGRGQRLGGRAPHGARRRRGCGRRGRGCAAAQQQVVPPQADVGVTAGGGVHLLGVDGATRENRDKSNR